MQTWIHPLETSKDIIEDHDDTEGGVRDDHAEVADVETCWREEVAIGIAEGHACHYTGKCDRQDHEEIDRTSPEELKSLHCKSNEGSKNGGDDHGTSGNED